MTLYKRAENAGLLPDDDFSWTEDQVPVENRGVKFSWLYNFVRQIGEHLEDEWIKYSYQEKASMYFDHVPSPSAPEFPRYQELTPRFLVPNMVQPLTRKLKCPLYARVPIAQRGKPNIFISHTWSQPLVVDGAFCTLESIKQPTRKVNFNDDPYIWIDIVAYNQHQSFENIASDMKIVIQSIGQVCLPLLDATPFSRLWCLWEILCAYTTGAEITICETNTSVYNLGRVFRIFSEEFHSVSDALTTKPEDRKVILEAMISTFGSLHQTDEYLYKLIQDGLSHEEDKPWKEAKE